MRPVEPGAGQQPDRAPVQPGMHNLKAKFPKLVSVTLNGQPTPPNLPQPGPLPAP
jgi:hypothetical protein